MDSGADAFLRLCDACCDNSGTLKEMIKTGGCTCDVCGWSCQCSADGSKQYVNRIPARIIPDEGWPYLQRKNEHSLRPIDWAAFYTRRA
jgi:hypothetical protein